MHVARSLRSITGLVALASLAAAAVPVAGASVHANAHHAKGGGEIAFGLEAENNDYCLSSAQMAISGIQVAAAVYDTLTVPNSEGVAVPYLAESVEPNAEFTEWTIGLRDGVQFHDGTPLDAAAVKLNLDAYRAAPDAPNSGPLFGKIFDFIADVSVVDPATVKVTLKTPVPAFPSFLFSQGRIGIMAPAQINAGADCATKMIGTGPFELESYAQNEKTVVTRNPDYWQQGFPKLDRITFVPLVDAQARVNQLVGGQLDVVQTSSGNQVKALQDLDPSTAKTFEQKPGFRELNYYALLSDTKPLSNPDARKAVALAIDKNEIQQIRTQGVFPVANGLMDVKAPGYLKNAGYPKHNLQEAKKLVAKVKAEEGSFDITLGDTPEPENSAQLQLVQEQLQKAGINATITLFDEATLINKALAGDIDVLQWRNLHGGYSNENDSDEYPWWSNYDTGNFINFSHFSNPETQALLDQGRGQSALADIDKTYTAFNQAMAKNNYIVPLWYVNWTIGYQPKVKLALPPLPDGNGKPLFVYGRIPVLGISTS
ncbi:MAG: ABC transporter substrate-binding protein [Acidimicrobiia bacterium]|nr:ABC transporter substrate-binding protein [Acidimicrobiia bacterium]